MAQVKAALRLVAAAALVAILCVPAEAARKRSRKPAARKPAASVAATARPDSALYDQARVYSAALRKSTSRQKNRANWEAAALRFRRVVDRYPKSALCDDALLNMGNLYREMGERFASARYRAEAVKSYRWIVSEYPASKLGDPALYAVYELSRDTSGAGKDKTSEAARAYLAAYPRGTHAADLREGMKKRAPEKVASLPAPPPPGTSEVFDLRQWGGDNSVRVVLDLDKTVELHHARGGDDANRLVVGLANARLHPNLADKVVHRDDGLLRGAQLVPRTGNDVDLVLDFADLRTYSVFYLQNPLRLVIDAQGPEPAVASAAAAPASSPLPGTAPPAAAPAVAEAPEEPVQTAAVTNPAGITPPPHVPRGIDSAIDQAAAAPAGALKEADAAAASETVMTSEDQHKAKAPEESAVTAPVLTAPPVASAVVLAPLPSVIASATPSGVPDRRKNPVRIKKVEPEAKTEAKAEAKPETKPEPTPAATPAPVVVRAMPSAPPQTNRSGSYSLARQLGLKARKIVIDAGHGGHDPGTIGHGGLQEKDLVLDVALRVAQMLRNELGVEVVMTRDSDVFIPLEERTAIANAKGADLFLSIHANSSRSRKARGIETYYLNFAGTPHAESVAARENAVSSGTMKDLQGLVKTIMLNSKIPESRDFASAVQESMVENVRSMNPEIPDRGVHTAPFYVLIGATMPSVLSEIAFVSHPEEESLLKKDGYRDTIAQSLVGGVRAYLDSLPAGTAVADTGNRRQPTARARAKR